MQSRDPWALLGRQQISIASSLHAIDAALDESPEWSFLHLGELRQRALLLNQIEERTVHPRLRALPALRPWLEAAIDGHDSIAAGFDDARDRTDRARWRLNVRALGNTMRRHFAQEETWLYARARAELDPQDARSLAAVIASMLGSHSIPEWQGSAAASQPRTSGGALSAGSS